jgi:hypothetical protein
VDVTYARYDRGAGRLRLTLHGAAAETAKLELSGVWGRTPWVLLVDGVEVADGDAADIRGGGLPVRRADDRLQIELPIRKSVELEWVRR